MALGGHYGSSFEAAAFAAVRELARQLSQRPEADQESLAELLSADMPPSWIIYPETHHTVLPVLIAQVRGARPLFEPQPGRPACGATVVGGDVKEPIRIQNLGRAQVVILYRPHPNVVALARQLAAIGLEVTERWPDVGPGGMDADFVFFDADMGHDEQFPWPKGEPPMPMPMIALIGSEVPGRVEWSLQAGVHAQLLKPVGAHGAYSVLLIARAAFAADIADLRRLDARQTFVRAVALLAARQVGNRRRRPGAADGDGVAAQFRRCGGPGGWLRYRGARR